MRGVLSILLFVIAYTLFLPLSLLNISSVLGKNQRDKTLSSTGKVLAGILDFIDKDHCKESIEELTEKETI